MSDRRRDIGPPIPRAPAGLGRRGRKLWREVLAEYTAAPHELVSLEAACRLLDDLHRIEAELKDAPVVIAGARGALRAHPLLGEARNHRAALTRILASLGLGEVAADATAKSNLGRQLARARWSGRSARSA